MKTKNAVALILIVFLMLACALIALVAFSLLTTGTSNSVGFSQSVQAMGLAIAGKQWYLEQLANDTDWTDQTDELGKSLGSGTFDIIINNASGNTVIFTSIGKVPGFLNQTVQRQEKITAGKLPKIARFAVLWQKDGPALGGLTFGNGGGGTHVIGNVWSVGSARIGSNSDVSNGIVYYLEGESIAGGGSYIAQEVPLPDPYPSMPVIDTSGYDALITDWNARIDDADSNLPRNFPQIPVFDRDVDWTNQTIDARSIDTNGFNITGTNFTVNCRSFRMRNGDGGTSDINASNFTINCSDDFVMEGGSRIISSNYRINGSKNFLMRGNTSIASNNFELYLDDNFDTNGNNVNVSGYGYIVCSNNGRILLHHENSDSGKFTVTPSSGDIFFLSGDSMEVNSNRFDTDVEMKPGCFLYSRNPSGNRDELVVRSSNTTIDGATLIAERRLIVQNGAKVTNSELYVATASTNQNNDLQITGMYTNVSGLVISRGRRHPSLIINNSASVTGLVYQYGTATRGRAQVAGGSTITGGLWVCQFHNTTFGPATVTYGLSDILAALPEGFGAFASQEPYTWDDH
ncbi:hypothetical protein ACFL1E_03770 [Candidatus Omnitrophota bacterium]